jgi:hypothetical protein
MIGIFKRLESDNLPPARSVDKKIAYRPKQQSPILHFFILGFELEPCLLDQVLGIVPVLGLGVYVAFTLIDQIAVKLGWMVR